MLLKSADVGPSARRHPTVYHTACFPGCNALEPAVPSDAWGDPDNPSSGARNCSSPLLTPSMQERARIQSSATCDRPASQMEGGEVIIGTRDHLVRSGQQPN